MLKDEVFFRGSPAQFAITAERFANRLFLEEGANVFAYTGDFPPAPDANPVRVLIFPPEGGLGTIEAQAVPDGALLAVFAQDDAWGPIRPWWDRLRSELERQGWIRPDAEGEAEAEKKASKRGMSHERRERALLFLQILRETPQLSQRHVAKAAVDRYFQKHGGKRPDWTEDTLRHDFKAMGWDWRTEKRRALEQQELERVERRQARKR